MTFHVVAVWTMTFVTVVLSRPSISRGHYTITLSQQTGTQSVQKTGPTIEAPHRPNQVLVKEKQIKHHYNSLILGGTAYGRPSCVSFGNRRVDCVYQGERSEAYHLTSVAGIASTPKSLGGFVYKNVQCLVPAHNKISCVVLWDDNTIASSSMTNEIWSEWKHLDKASGELGESQCTKRDEDTYTCLFRMQRDRPAAVEYRGDEPGAVTFLTASYRTPFSCISSSTDSVTCYTLCYNNQLCKLQWKKDTSWMKGVTIRLRDVFQTSPPSAVVSSFNTHHVFGTDQDHYMFHFLYTDQDGYAPFSVLEDLIITSTPECVAVGETGVFCFALSMDHVLHRTYYDGTEWSKWQSMSGGVFLDKPSCVLSDTREISCLARSFKSSLIQTTFYF